MRASMIFFLFGLFFGVACVDRSNFRTCKESSFCTHQRDYWPTEALFIVDNSSVNVSDFSAYVQILHTFSNKRLNLTITYHQGSIFRILIDENDPLRPRFRTRTGIDSLASEPELFVFKTALTEAELSIWGSNEEKAVVSFRPFKITFYKKNVEEVSLNERNFLYFEHYVEKQSTQTSPPEPQVIEPPVLPDENVDSSVGEKENGGIPEETLLPPQPVSDDWSEHFKGHKDSRPYGPASIGIDFTFHGYDYVYGIPQHADRFALRNTNKTDPYRLYNLDVFEYELNNPMAIYGSVPVLWSHKKTATVGIFVNNPSEAWIDVESRKNVESGGILSNLPRFFSKPEEYDSSVWTRWMFETGVLDVFVILADNPQSALKSYTSLTGTTPLPPLFSLGHHQCRWNYKDQADVKSVSDNYDKYGLPVDVLWLDIEHSDGKRYLSWDKTNFPNPNDMVDDLFSKGRKLVVVVDPHIKRDNGWSTYNDGKKNDVYIKTADGESAFDGWCWPGSSEWPDFYRPEVANWWSNLFSLPSFLDIQKPFYVWNDMNEPSVFSGAEVTIPKDVKHGSDGEWENRDIHNLYGLWVHQASWDGLLQRSNYQERPFVLTRAFFAGSQRTSAVWTGDNKASWDHLQITTPMLLSLSMAGITFCGSDVGGFFGHPSGELNTRWYQAAAFHPFLRAHAHIDSPRRESWTYEKHFMDAIREALTFRYALLPYWYTLFARGEFEGLIPMAPLFYHFPTDEKTFAIDDEFMVGEALLVHPVVHEGATTVDIYLPKGTWYLHKHWTMYSGEQTISLEVDLNTIPVFYRGGHIVPKKERLRRSSVPMAQDPYTLLVAMADPSGGDGDKGSATGFVYFDDFHSTDRSSARFFRIDYRNGVLSLQLESLRGMLQRATTVDVFVPTIERIFIVGAGERPRQVYVSANGSNRDVEFSYLPADGANKSATLVVRKPEVEINSGWELHVV